MLTGFSVKPRIYDVATSWGLDQLIGAAMNFQPQRLVYPGQTAELPFRTRVEDAKQLDNVDQRVTIRIYWRRTGSPWMPRIPLTLRVRTSDVTKLSGVAPR